MSSDHPSNSPSPIDHSVADRNVEKLLAAAYDPEVPDPALLQRTTSAMLAAAAKPSPAAAAPRLVSPRLLSWAVAAALLIGVGTLIGAMLSSRGHNGPPAPSGPAQNNLTSAPHLAALPGEPIDPIRIAPQPPSASGHLTDTATGLTARPGPQTAPAEKLAVGSSLQTAANQRRRIQLDDGSLLYLNQNSAVTLTAPRHVSLERGEVFVEVAHRPNDATATSNSTKSRLAPFTVSTPDRKIVALGTKFDVRLGAIGTSVVVTQGKVQVSGLDLPLIAGQQLAPQPTTSQEAPSVTAAPRASHLLDWTRDLLSAAEAALVPLSQYAGGALVVIDPNGQQANLSLRKFHLDVYLEDGFARTTIDQTYFNHLPSRLEGTFYFPLPPDASLSRLAMYVEGRLMEGGMVERDYGRQVFESIMYRQKDPALLEWVDGSTFKMRVFPLEGRQEKRIILSYTQRLPSLYGRSEYRFPAGHNLELVDHWSTQIRAKSGAAWRWQCSSHDLKESKEGPDLVLQASADHVKLDRDLVLTLSEERPSAAPHDAKPNPEMTPDKTQGNATLDGSSDPRPLAARWTSAVHEQSKYLMLRWRPQLPVQPNRTRRDWIILFESSADRDPLLARAQIEIVKTLLENAEHDDTFAILTASTQVHALSEKPQPATPGNVKQAVQRLEQTHLVGALDLGRALAAAEPLVKAAKNAHLVHVGSAVPILGQRELDTLLKKVPQGACYVGIGVGKRWSRSFMKEAAARSGGYFTQINPDEKIAWRTFELLATLNTPRLLNIHVVDRAEKVSFLCCTDSLAQGEELCAVARIDTPSLPWPDKVEITGTLGGEPFREVLAVDDVAEKADYLPRTWAKLQIDRLVADGAETNRPRIIELSKAMYVMSPFTSLLVLENEAMYTQYQVDRGRKDHWAMYPCPEKIPVVCEPLPSQPVSPSPASASGNPSSPAEILQTILVRIPPQWLQWPNQPGQPGSATVPVLNVLKPQWSPPQMPPQMINYWGDLGGWGEPAATQFDGDTLFDWSIAEGRTRDVRVWFRTWKYADQPLDAGVINDNFGRGRYNYGNTRFDWHDFAGPVTSPTLAGGQYVVFPQQMPFGSLSTVDSRRFYQANTDLSFSFLLDGTVHFVNDGKLYLRDGVAPSQTGDFYGRLPAVYVPFSGRDAGGKRSLVSGLSMSGDGRLLAMPGSPLSRTNVSFTADFDSLIGLITPHVNPTTWNLTVEPNFGELLGNDPSQVFGQAQPIEPTFPWAPASDLAAAVLANRLQAGLKWPTETYQKPTFPNHWNAFYDLVSYAPGLNTTLADVLAVLQSEIPGRRAPSGQVDKPARDLLEKARGAGWHTAVFKDSSGRTLLSVDFDGTGRYRYQRTTASGLREQVLCDGASLWHLYPELGLGAQRTLSRFHRAQLQRILPWIVPSAEDLAHDANLVAVDEHTLAIVPSQTEKTNDAEQPRKHGELQLVFAEDGRLSERRWIQRPSGKTLWRQAYSPDGAIKSSDADGKTIAEFKVELSPCGAPDLKPESEKLVILPLPARTKNLRPSLDGVENWPQEEALGAIMAEADTEKLSQILVRRFLHAGDRRMGLYTLLFSSGFVWKPEEQQNGFGVGLSVRLDPLADHPNDPLAKYIVQCLKLRQNQADEFGLLGGPGDGLVQQLAEFRDLWTFFNERTAKSSETLRQNHRDRLLNFIRHSRSPEFALALLSIPGNPGGSDFYRQLLETLGGSAEIGPLSYFARYEQARAALQSSERSRSRQLFAKLFTETAHSGILAPVDAAFREAFHNDGEGQAAWKELMRKAANELLAANARPATIGLAWYVHQGGDPALAEEIFALALARAGEDQPLATTLVAVEYLSNTAQQVRADNLLQPLLERPEYAGGPSLWRLAALLAERRGMTARALKYSERAMELQFEHLPELVNLQAVRSDYGQLLGRYEQLAKAIAMLDTQPPRDFLTRVIRAVDRWRSLDPDPTAACQTAARIFSDLGAAELAWDYLTTPLAAKPNEAAPWRDLAATLRQQGQLELADRAYASAFNAEPTNAQILWDRAQVLLEAGRASDAQSLYRRIAQGQWGPSFDSLKSQVAKLAEKP